MIENQMKGQKVRFREIIESYLKITQIAFSENTGIAQGYISQILGGKNITNRILLKVLNRYPEINANWLLTGKGEMLINGKDYEKKRVFVKSDKELELELENKKLREKIYDLQSEIIDLLKNKKDGY